MIVLTTNNNEEIYLNPIKISEEGERNGAKNVNYFKINFDELSKSTQQYDKIVCPDLLGLDFHPQLIINIFRRLLKIGG